MPGCFFFVGAGAEEPSVRRVIPACPPRLLEELHGNSRGGEMSHRVWLQREAGADLALAGGAPAGENTRTCGAGTEAGMEPTLHGPSDRPVRLEIDERSPLPRICWNRKGLAARIQGHGGGNITVVICWLLPPRPPPRPLPRTQPLLSYAGRPVRMDLSARFRLVIGTRVTQGRPVERRGEGAAFEAWFRRHGLFLSSVTLLLQFHPLLWPPNLPHPCFAGTPFTPLNRSCEGESFEI